MRVSRDYIHAMEQYPPSDWTPPAKAGKRDVSRKLNISPAAGAALAELRQKLEDWPAWVHSTSGSVMIEYLVWLFENSERRYRGFHPETKRGRPTSVNFIENFRPAAQRKAAGLSRTEARLGPKPPKE